MDRSRTPVLTALALFMAALSYSAEIAGKWEATFKGTVGPQKYSYSFQVKGSILTGKADTGWGETEIRDGKIDGDEISFVEIIDFAGETTRVTYKGKISGEEIKFSRQVGDIGGEEFVARRVK